MHTNSQAWLLGSQAFLVAGDAVVTDHRDSADDGSDQQEIDAAWHEEIERRLQALDEGKAHLVPGNEVMRSMLERKRQ